jgi:phosphoglycerate dehydrogenase-like enzyme
MRAVSCFHSQLEGIELRQLPLVVTFEVKQRGRAAITEALGGVADVIFLSDVEGSARSDALKSAGALLVRNSANELRQDELVLIRKARLIQFMSAGIDFIPLHDLPQEVPMASNAGAYAEPMAEHALAMALAAAKRLFVEHGNLSRGQFNQFVSNKMLAGGVCGVFGFGGVGIATARLMRCLGMRIHAINRRGATEEPVDWIGTPDRLNTLLAASDVMVISAPLTRSTEGVIGARQLSLMKGDAIMVNLARGEIVDGVALFAHLRANPRFTACIDAWWVEPIRHGEFRMDQPFLQLPNVIGSPHNSASTSASYEVGLQRAVENCRRALIGEVPLHLIKPDEPMS